LLIAPNLGYATIGAFTVTMCLAENRIGAILLHEGSMD